MPLVQFGPEDGDKKVGSPQGRNNFNKSSQLLAFADDIDIIARSINELKQVFYNIERAAKNMGLEINEKTKILVSTTSKARATRIGPILTIEDYNFEIVNAFNTLARTAKTISVRK